MWLDTTPVDELISDLRGCEAEISELRARQIVVLQRLERAQVTQRDASQSMVDWTAANLDVSVDTARALVTGVRLLPRYRFAGFGLADREMTFDRALATARLAATGVPHQVVADSTEVDLATVSRLAAKHRRVRPGDEQQAFRDRYLTMQPTLDESSWRLWGQLPGPDGRVVEKALTQRSDELRHLPHGEEATRSQRQADALVTMAQDSLDHTTGQPDGGDGNGGGGGGGFLVSVFADLDAVAGSGGELGAEIEYRPRVGPETLREALCNGAVRLIGLADGRPVVTSDATSTIPAAIRAFVARRDGRCTIEGCRSRYRLQPHHISHRAHGGTHDPANLTTLCWYHHLVAIHGNGYRIDPNSPPLRRRLIPTPGRAPPH